ncbi:MAG: hypothetical protein ABIJ09_02605 [Pseudomonadota bacterium]
MVEIRRYLSRCWEYTSGAARRGPGVLVLTAVATALALVFYRPYGETFGTKLVTGHVDAYFVLWGVDWVQRQCFGLCGPLFDSNVYFPHRFSLLHADPMIGQALVTLPLRWLDAGPAATFNTLQLLGLVSAGVAMALLAAELTGHRWSALVALVVFGFFPARAAAVTNALSQYSFGLPLMLWALVSWTRRGRSWSIWACGGAFVLQAWFSTQMALWTALGFVVTAPWILLGGQAWRTRQQLRQLGLAMIVWLVILAPLVVGYLRMGHDLGFTRSMRETVAYSGSTDALWNERGMLQNDPWLQGEASKGGGHLGLLLCALAAAGCAVLLWRRARGDRAALWQHLLPGLLLLALGVIVYLGPTDKSHGDSRALFWYVRELVPGFKGVRVPARGLMLAYVGLALLAAEGARGLFAWARWPGVRPLAAVSLAAALFWFWLPRPQNPVMPSVITDAAVVMRDLPAGAVVLPWPSFRHYHDGALRDYEATAHDKHIVGGYTGIFTWLYRQCFLELDQFPGGRSLEVAAALGTTHLVLDSRRLDGKRRDALGRALSDGRVQGPVLTRGPFEAYVLVRGELRQFGAHDLHALAPLSALAEQHVEAGSWATSALQLPADFAAQLRINPTQTWKGRVRLACPHGRDDADAVVAAPPIVDDEHRLVSFSYRAPAQPGVCDAIFELQGTALGTGRVDVVAAGPGTPRAEIEILDAPASTWADCGVRLHLRIRNTGPVVLRARSDVGWPPFKGEFQVECRFTGPASETLRVVSEWGDGALHADLGPGDRSERTLRIRAPRKGGHYKLQCKPVLAYTSFIGDGSPVREIDVVP